MHQTALFEAHFLIHSRDTASDSADIRLVGWLVVLGFTALYLYTVYVLRLVGPLFWVKRPFETVFQSISSRLPKRGRKRRVKIDESKSVQTTPTGTYCKHSRPLPYYHPNCRTPGHWKFTQDHRTTRPPLADIR